MVGLHFNVLGSELELVLMVEIGGWIWGENSPWDFLVFWVCDLYRVRKSEIALM